MSSTAAPPAESPSERDQLLGYVAQAFRGQLSEADCEDAVQQAYLQLFDAEARGHQIRDRWQWLRTTAWRRADDRWRSERRRLGDGNDETLEVTPARDQNAIDRIDTGAALARAREALAQLSARERDAFRASYSGGLGTDEACRLLGVPRSTYFELRRRAREHITNAALGVSDRFDRDVLALMNAFLAGATDSSENERLKRLLTKEPRYAVVFRELRSVHDKVGATLPPLTLEPHLRDRIGEWLSAPLDGLRQLGARLLGGHPEATEGASSAAAASPAARGAGAASAGALAKLGLAGGAGNAALACLGGGIALTACVATGLLPTPGILNGARVDRPPAAERGHTERASMPRPRIVPSGAVQAVAASPRTLKTPADDAQPSGSGSPAPSSSEPATDPVAPSTPVEQQEFGVAAGAVPVSGAPADTNDSNGASASTVRGEFGP